MGARTHRSYILSRYTSIRDFRDARALSSFSFPKNGVKRYFHSDRGRAGASQASRFLSLSLSLVVRPLRSESRTNETCMRFLARPLFNFARALVGSSSRRRRRPLCREEQQTSNFINVLIARAHTGFNILVEI